MSARLAAVGALLCASTTTAQQSASRPMLLGAQATIIRQWLREPAGRTDLTSRFDAQSTASYGLYGGWRASSRLQLYTDVEWLHGTAVVGGRGFAGIPNGDAVAPTPVPALSAPFIARAFARYTIPLGAAVEEAARGIDQVPGTQPRDRVELKLGRMAATDDFDANRYASNARSQFMNWALFSNEAWDTAAVIHPRWSVRAGTYLMSSSGAESPAIELRRSRSDIAQVTAIPGSHGTVMRAFIFRNVGLMSSYREALHSVERTGGAPSLDSVARFGQAKVGGGVNVEQPLSPHGNFGILVRAGWSDGRSNGFETAEVDRHLSIGGQYRLRRWIFRHQDYLGFGMSRQSLSADHRDFLAAQGTAFFIGPTQLSYQPETVVEGYYRAQIGCCVQAGPDLQSVSHPGYDGRVPRAVLLALRIHAEY
jgi:high affinity Mn2+ porin